MSEPTQSMTIQVNADTSGFRRDMEECDKLAGSFAKSMTSAFTSASLQGQSFSQVVNGLGLKLSGLVLNTAFKPIGDMMSSGLGSVLNGAFQGLGTLFGQSLPSLSSIMPFAQGGIVSAPSYFPMPDGGTGLMGERGSEAIVPLSRMNDGRLGIAASGSNGPSIVMNVTTPNAESFSRSEAEISAMLAKAVGRGQRNL